MKCGAIVMNLVSEGYLFSENAYMSKFFVFHYKQIYDYRINMKVFFYHKKKHLSPMCIANCHNHYRTVSIKFMTIFKSVR